MFKKPDFLGQDKGNRMDTTAGKRK